MKKKINFSFSYKLLPILLIGIFFTTVAFAQTSYDLNVNGSLSLDIQDGIIITDVKVSDVDSETSYATVNHYVDTLLTNTIGLSNASSYVTLAVTIKNTDNVKHKFAGILYDDTGKLDTYSNLDITPEVISTSDSLSVGDIITEKETKTIYVKYKYSGSEFANGLLEGTINLNFIRLYEITYVLNGGTQAKGQVTTFEAGETINLLNPTKSNADFAGWYTNENYTGNSVSQLTTSAENITLYAHFLNYYNVYFQMPPDWYKDDTDEDYKVSIYLYNSSTGEYYSTWAGTEMEKVDNNKSIYSFRTREDTLDKYDHVIFNNGKTINYFSTVEEEKTHKQTIDIPFSNSNYGKVFVPELYSSNSNETRLFARPDRNFHYYIWRSSDEKKLADWPGTEFTDKISGSTLQAKIDRSIYDKIIINKGNNTKETRTIDIPTTQDLTISFSDQYEYYYVIRCFYDGGWYNYDNWTEREYANWYDTDYQVFSKTNETIDSINYYLN